MGSLDFQKYLMVHYPYNKHQKYLSVLLSPDESVHEIVAHPYYYVPEEKFICPLIGAICIIGGIWPIETGTM